jgi:hypothetical protein
MPLNPLVAPAKEEELEEAPLDVNVFKRPREEELSRRVVRTQVIVWHGIVDCLLTHML